MSDKNNNLKLFEVKETWEKEWEGMPEYNQKDLSAYKSLIVNFETREDMLAFSKLVNQRLTYKTQSIWYPEATINRYANKRYIDIKEDKDES